ncbi:MAG TPA: hypothetical protein VNF26_08235 [Candidatus Baltobacterales bacterium]|nr:hypothetical protein [Candidatus Baltobacterales bacterium]
MKLYHRTTRVAAEAILAGGFKDGTGTYMTTREWTGVWLSARPLDFADGIPNDWVAILEIKLPARVVRAYEFEGKTAEGSDRWPSNLDSLSLDLFVNDARAFRWSGPDREFLVPAAIVNAAGRPSLTLDED